MYKYSEKKIFIFIKIFILNSFIINILKKRFLQRTRNLDFQHSSLRPVPFNNSFRFRDSYTYPLLLTFFFTFFASVFLFLSIITVTVCFDQSYKRVFPLQAFGVFCTENLLSTSDPFREFRGRVFSISRSRGRTFSLPTDTEHHRPHQKFGSASRRSNLSLTFRSTYFPARNPSGNPVSPLCQKFPRVFPRNNATSNSSGI